MGNGCCGHEVIFTEFIEDNQFQKSKLILGENLGQRGLDFISNHQLDLWKVRQGGDKYYCGKFNQGRGEGLAIVFVPNNFYFQGTMRNGLPEGYGYFKSLNQAQFYQEYQGDFRQGMAHGKGKLSSSNQEHGFFFEGEWQNSEVTKGRLRSLSASELDYIDFSQSGNFIRFKNGDTYEGDLNNYFEPSGLGTFNYNNSNSTQRYVGQWQRGKFNGDGVCTWRDGSSYAGTYSNGEKQGQGKYVYSSNKYYEGHWLEGKQHGIGTLYDSDGNVLERGVWMKGKCVLKIDEIDQQKFQGVLPVTHENQLQNPAKTNEPKQ